jgi:MFS family permease
MVVAPLAGYISDRFDARYISSAGMAVIALGLYLISNVKADTKIFIIIIYTMVIGIGIGTFQTPNNSAIMGSVPANRRGVASSMLATMRNLGMVLGIAISGTLFNSRLNKLTKIFSIEGYTGTELTNRAFTGAMKTTLLVATALACVAVFTSLIRGPLNKKTK